jgi:hypothetical protein
MTSEGGNHQKAGAVELGGSAQAALAQYAHRITVGEIGFGPSWGAEDAMAASIIRLEQELEEATARIALLEEEQKILAKSKPSLNCCESCGVAWADHLGISGTCKALQEALQTIESLRDTLCENKCRDKAAADRGWANI